MKSLVYVGMDVHKASYSLCCFFPSAGEFFGEAKIEAGAKLVKADLAEMSRVLSEKGFDDVAFVTGYEAGCLGFSLYKDLTKIGIECKVIAPTTLSVEACISKKKSDRKDAKMLARNLAYGTCKFVHIPDDVDLETKEYIRMRADHVIALKKVKQQINALCLRLGEEYSDGAKWTAKHLGWLKGLKLPGLVREALDEYIDTYEKASEKLERLNGKIAERAEMPRYKETTDRFNCLKGVTKQGALTVVAEIGDFSRFETPNELCSYLGLAPGENSSGQRESRLGITKLGNGAVRTQLVESAQAIVRGTPGKKSKKTSSKQAGMPARVVSYCDRATERMMRKFRRLLGRNVAYNKAIVAIARELACFLWGLANDRLDGRPVPAKAAA